MSTILTETSTFSATVTVPSDGDAGAAASVITGIQSLTNRTKYLKDTQDKVLSVMYWAEFFPTGAAWTTLSKLALSTGYDPQSAFGYSSGDITVPSAGYYKVTTVLRGTYATPNASALFYVRNNTSNVIPGIVCGNTADTGTVEVVRDGIAIGVVFVSDPSTDKINIYNGDANTIDLVTSPSGFSRILIEKIGNTL